MLNIEIGSEVIDLLVFFFYNIVNDLTRFILSVRFVSLFFVIRAHDALLE